MSGDTTSRRHALDRRSVLLLGGAMGFAGALPARAQTPAGVAETPMTPDAGGRFTIEVTLNKAGPFRFVVDSAAMGPVIAAGTAVKAGLAPKDGGFMVGASGSQAVSQVTVQSYASGVFDRANQAMLVMPDAHLGSVHDGVVGIDAFAGRRLEFDFPAGRLRVGPSGPTPKGFAAVPSKLIYASFMIADVTVDGVRAKALIDTGAGRTSANPKLQAALGIAAGDARLTPAEPVRGATSQQTAAWKASLGQIRLGTVVFAAPVVTFADLPIYDSIGIGDGPALILGIDQLRTLKGLAIDYPQGALQIRP